MAAESYQSEVGDPAPGVSSIGKLDTLADFHFTHWSDIWGVPPDQDDEMVTKFAEWTVESGSEFAVTSGDHLTAPRDGYYDQWNMYIADSDRSDDF